MWRAGDTLEPHRPAYSRKSGIRPTAPFAQQHGGQGLSDLFGSFRTARQYVRELVRVEPFDENALVRQPIALQSVRERGRVQTDHDGNGTQRRVLVDLR